MNRLPAVVGCVTVLTVVSTPAMAASIPLPQAAAELNAAFARTNAEPSYRYQETGSSGAQAAYNAAGQYEEDHFSFGHQLVFEGVGNFHEIEWRSDAVRDTVRGYLDKPALQWEFVVGPNRYEYLEWADVPFNRYGRLDDLNTASLRVADKTTSESETIYRVSFAGNQLVDVYTVDAAGRLARRELADQSGKLLDNDRETWDFVPVTLTQPSPDTVAPIRQVDEAIEAATLGTTIKRVARDAAKTANRRDLSPKKAQGVVRAKVFSKNYRGNGFAAEPLSLYLKIKHKGTRIFRENPFTGELVSWRIVQRGGKWKAVRTKA